jgi:DedD protein
MRFEIRAGGTFLILAGLLGLSGAVFGLGLVAGYEMASKSQPDLNQISSTYPLPNPSERPAPVAEMSAPAVAPSPAIAVAEPRPVVAPIKPPASVAREETPAARISPAAVARARPPAIAPAANPPADDDEDAPDETETAAAAAPAPLPRPRNLPPGAHPYNIQIEAVMDKSGADEMVTRLKSLGYNAQETKIVLGGEPWYRVRVGPYASAEEATAAQNRLREQYKQAYTTSH